MKPLLHVTSGKDRFLQDLVECVSSVDCSEFFANNIGTLQREQRKIVLGFQTMLINHLRRAFKAVEWKHEYRHNSALRDSIDIFGMDGCRLIAIELDKNRADQVAKKFVSRMAFLPSTESIYFLSLCYPGTARMNKTECVKYFDYCKTLAIRLGSHYAGFIIQ